MKQYLIDMVTFLLILIISVMIIASCMYISLQVQRSRCHMEHIEDNLFYCKVDNFVYIERSTYGPWVHYELFFDGEGHLVKYVNNKWEPVVRGK